MLWRWRQLVAHKCISLPCSQGWTFWRPLWEQTLCWRFTHRLLLPLMLALRMTSGTYSKSLSSHFIRTQSLPFRGFSYCELRIVFLHPNINNFSIFLFKKKSGCGYRDSKEYWQGTNGAHFPFEHVTPLWASFISLSWHILNADRASCYPQCSICHCCSYSP